MNLGGDVTPAYNNPDVKTVPYKNNVSHEELITNLL